MESYLCNTSQTTLWLHGDCDCSDLLGQLTFPFTIFINANAVCLPAGFMFVISVLGSSISSSAIVKSEIVLNLILYCVKSGIVWC